MKDSENQVMLTFCLRVTPIVCRRFQYLEMGKWKWVQQKVMDKIFNRNYVSVIIIINFINLRYLWTIPWTSLLFLSSRIFATSPRNSTSLAWSYHCCQHCHCRITLSPHLPVLPLPWFSGPFNITILTWYLASTMANSGRALLLGAFDTTFKTKRLEEENKLKMPTWPSHVSLCWAFVSAAISITSARSGKDASTWAIRGLCWPPSYTTTLSKRNPDMLVLMLANEAYTLLVCSSWWCYWCFPPDWLPDLLGSSRRLSDRVGVHLYCTLRSWGADAMFTHTLRGQYILMLTYRFN